MQPDPTELASSAHTPSLGSWFRQLTRRLRTVRRIVVMVADATMVFTAWQLTYLFRLGFGGWLTDRPLYDLWVSVVLVGIYLLVMGFFGIERGAWRYVSFTDIRRLTAAGVVAGLVGAVAVLMAHLVQIPRAVLALHPFMAIMMMTLIRIGFRMVYEQSRVGRAGGDPRAKIALVLGAGEAGRLLVAGIHNRGWKIVGFLDDDRSKQGTRIVGIPVLGTLEALRDVEITDGVTHLLMALPGATGAQRRRALTLASSAGLPILTVPSNRELEEGRSRIERVRDIEPEDLLGRERVHMDEATVAELIVGKVVLVTGAGGSIGSELCRQIARFGPQRLILIELSEFALYAIDQELTDRHPGLPLARWIVDVKDGATLERCFEQERPQLVFHAAAYKHVPLMENENAFAAVRNNIWGTFQVAGVAARCGVERFVLISTDKAVNPTNVMGASKRAAEMVVAHQAQQCEGTRFIAVRFGNVLGSSGSVIPRFKDQIARGGPVTVTHPDITRYFMTIPEASQLVMQAAALAQSGQVFVLDMGEPVKIAELAKEMIHLSGHDVGDIPIIYTGLRPGEKLYEELLADSDTTLPTAHPRLRIARLNQDVSSTWMEGMLALTQNEGLALDSQEVKSRLRALVPEYRPL